MSATFLIIILTVGLFAANYFMKRRFGLLALALAAGALVSQYWAESVTLFIAEQGMVVMQPQVEIVLTILPALILLFAGPTYGKIHMQIIGSALFTLLALALVLRPLGMLMQFDSAGLAIYEVIDQYQGVIIVAGLLIAIADVFLGRSGGHKMKKSTH